MRTTAYVVAIALAARLAIVAWAFDRIRPIADGEYYHVLGRRIAEGLGYTWLWPDGAVTYAAHYPVGYPGLVALSYWIAGPSPGCAMVMNALFGALGAGFLHRAALQVAPPRIALAAAVFGFALHPALLSYTPALMTEGVCASFVAAACYFALASRTDRRARRVAALAGLGLVLGAATLVRPQLLALSPAFAFFAHAFSSRSGAAPSPRPSFARRCAKLGVVSALALAGSLAVVAPWTARNCDRIGRCALVSLNGGWNLLIGADPSANGTWSPVKVPAACLEVYDEADKDRCLGREGVRMIAADPLGWLALGPKKLAATFNHVGAGPWYLHDSNPAAFSEQARLRAAILEEVAQRFLFALALVGATAPWVRGRPRRVSRSAFALAILVGLAAPGWITVLTFSCVAIGAAWARSRDVPRANVLAIAGITTLMTALTHLVFFGAGRYALVVIPALVLAAACSIRMPFDISGQPRR